MTKLRDVPHDFDALDVVLSFVAGRADGQPHPSGSGVFIAPGLALTATHVLKDYSDRFEDIVPWDKSGVANFGIQAIQYRAGGAEPALWDVWSVGRLVPLDIAVVQLAPHSPLAENFGWPYITMDVSPPAVGTRVQAFGFPQSLVRLDEAAGRWVLDEVPAGSIGQLTQVFLERRDATLMPFPSFEMNLQILGGMSGGPVFRESGHLCGILCSSFDVEEGASDISYASLLWPSLALRLSATQNLGIWNGAETTIAELSRHGAVDVVNYESALPMFSRLDSLPPLANER